MTSNKVVRKSHRNDIIDAIFMSERYLGLARRNVFEDNEEQALEYIKRCIERVNSLERKLKYVISIQDS